MKKVALLATGDEIINGDLFNSNGQQLARRLFEHGITPGQQMTATDDKQEIHDSLASLAKSHQVIITIGGLGPTSDDLTRFAITDFCQQELIFSNESWQRIVERGRKLNIKMHQSNRQQAYFPNTAKIIANPHGTADACIVEYGHLSIIMLPGPPRECLPIFDQFILPYLINLGLAEKTKLYRWRLLGVSEAQIAADVTNIVTAFNYIPGFRAHFPYTEVKLLCKNNTEIDRHCEEQLETLFTPYLASRSEQGTSEVLVDYLINNQCALNINDQAGLGYFHSQLLQAKTRELLRHPQGIKIQLEGLAEFWSKDQASHTEVTITVGDKSYLQPIPLRGQATLAAFVEYSSWVILKHLTTTLR